MPHRPAACAALLAVFLTATTAAHAADVVRPSSVSRTTFVPAGGSATLALTCPAGAVALNAAVEQQGPGVRMRRSMPGETANTWRFRLANAARGPRQAAAVLRCVRLEVPNGISGVQLAVKTRNESGVRVPAGGTSDVSLRCGPGWAATGYGLEPGADAARIRLAAAIPAARGWDFTVENTGSRLARTGVRVRCLKRDVPGRRGGEATRLRFALARPSFEDSVGPGSDDFAHDCGRRQFAVATGVSLDPADDIRLVRSFPDGGGSGVWAFRQAGAPQTVQSSLVCLGRGSRFG